MPDSSSSSVTYDLSTREIQSLLQLQFWLHAILTEREGSGGNVLSSQICMTILWN